MDLIARKQKPSSLQQYTRAAELAAAEVIGAYSTSFGWATKLVGKQIRVHIRNIYALVRVADEIVDGAADEALQGNQPGYTQHALDQLEAETYLAIESGFSTNLVVHAFAHTARLSGIKREIIEPFFTSMRMDIDNREYDQAGFDKYVYGSAEVVGLMCLEVYLMELDLTAHEKAEFVRGARALGAAFQKVNFLRDLAADFQKLGRSYFPGVNVASFNEEEKHRLVVDIQEDLKVSSSVLKKLPKSSRKAVAAAQMFFDELNRKIMATPAETLISERIRVSNGKKLVILIKAWIGVVP
ncbi:phytoene/squalene synthase family protein [Rhodoluna limnophila]|uniref:phytoene/squalene synthase family protein n=1 Tax=Rhodoluna limnophila TaxID=232537 RepID=UPI001FE59417|nr:phytoene/squalene synthase family protein [Rhodoluna limnophila]